MKTVWVKNGFRCGLAAWMLLALSTTSTTFMHGHADGHSPHRHDGTCYAMADLRLSVDLHDAGPSLSAANVHHHGFVTLLGTVTCLPTSDDSTVPHDKTPCNWCCWIATASTTQVVRAASNGQVLDWLAPCPDHMNSTAGATNSLLWRGVSHVDIPRDVLLCDRARHERSGVQLA